MSVAVILKGGEVLHLCDCCKEAQGHFLDKDLNALVCDPCQTSLRWSQAYLKKAGIRGCVRKNSDRAKGSS